MKPHDPGPRNNQPSLRDWDENRSLPALERPAIFMSQGVADRRHGDWATFIPSLRDELRPVSGGQATESAWADFVPFQPVVSAALTTASLNAQRSSSCSSLFNNEITTQSPAV